MEPHLTPREAQVVYLVVQGLYNKQIAAQLKISLQTVKNHMVSILLKTGCNNRTQLGVRFAHLLDAGTGI